MPTGADADPGEGDGPEEVRVVSTDRPIPLTAQMALEEYGLVRTERPEGGGPVEVAYLRRRPPDELLDEHDLRATTVHRELWRDHDDRLVEVRPETVLIDGTPTDIDPEEAREEARTEGYEPIDVPDDE
ncbi:hypothetical protein BRD00_15200 [Halobacteriales archaeon QS_8_69_26]|nr:MAG: hypothetical protein BRD00_15200 [Halobacteriales archaeon QS_8_69_26]